MPPVFQPISFIEKSEVSKNFEIPWFFQETVLKNILWKEKRRQLIAGQWLGIFSDPCACALQCTIRPATPHRERLRSLGCGSSVGQTLPVNQFFFMSSRDAEKNIVPLFFLVLEKKTCWKHFFETPAPWLHLGFSCCRQSRTFLVHALELTPGFPCFHSTIARAHQGRSSICLLIFFHISGVAASSEHAGTAPRPPPQWKNLCKEELNFKSYIFRFFLDIKKGYNQSTPDKFLALDMSTALAKSCSLAFTACSLASPASSANPAAIASAWIRTQTQRPSKN